MCPNGTYCGVVGMAVATGCPPGSYCPTGSTVPIACPKGSYSNQGGLRNSTDCTSCTPGYYCATTGLMAPSGQCKAGYYCIAGSYLPDPTATVVTTGDICPPGESLFSCGCGVELVMRAALVRSCPFMSIRC